MSIRILLADDFEPWRRFVCSTVQTEPEITLICEVSDGRAAVHKAKELKPDLILLDIGLPKLNGIAAAREIRKCAPESKILFLTQESSADVMREALAVGDGFLVKADAYLELLPAIKAIILDGRLSSSGLASYAFRQSGWAGTGRTERSKRKARVIATRLEQLWDQLATPIGLKLFARIRRATFTTRKTKL